MFPRTNQETSEDSSIYMEIAVIGTMASVHDCSTWMLLQDPKLRLFALGEYILKIYIFLPNKVI